MHSTENINIDYFNTKPYCVYIYIYTHSHAHNNITISSDIQDTTTCFGPVCRPSSGCRKNLQSDYTVFVVILEGGRDFVPFPKLPNILCSHLISSLDNLMMAYIQGRNMYNLAPFPKLPHILCSHLVKFFGQPDDGLHTGPKHV